LANGERIFEVAFLAVQAIVLVWSIAAGLQLWRLGAWI
jgi:hypothetical protein